MTPGKAAVQRLQDYLSKQKSHDAGYQFSCDLKGLKIQINIKEFDKFSFIMETLRIERSDDLQSGSDFLSPQALQRLDVYRRIFDPRLLPPTQPFCV